MISNIKHWLKYKIAGQELQERLLKQKVLEVGIWCCADKKAVAVSKYLLDMHDYPCQLKGASGSIEDFREYLKTFN